MNPKRLQPVEILLVEDSPTDALLARETLEMEHTQSIRSSGIPANRQTPYV